MANEPRSEYSPNFYDAYSSDSRKSASVIVPLVQKLVAPESVLDVGCGVGTWLAEWASHGSVDILGLDGDYVDKSQLQIPPDKFVPANIEHGFSLDRKFDLVESLEVAEHLGEAYADQFVESLTCHGDVILFSAAIPGQGGTHHVNEQWLSYWIEKFARLGFKPYDPIRPAIWSDQRVARWYRQNTVLFSKTRVFAGAESCPDLVHPDIWREGIDYGKHPVEIVRNFPAAVRSLVLERLGKSSNN